MSEKTLVIVAQRLSTIQQADNIIVLDEGKSLDKVLMKNYCLIAKLIRSLQITRNIERRDTMEKKNVEHACFDTFWKMIKPEHKYFTDCFYAVYSGTY